MASRIDKWKLRASLTLFDLATSEKGKKDLINSCLNEFYGGTKCLKTLKQLQESQLKFERTLLWV